MFDGVCQIGLDVEVDTFEESSVTRTSEQKDILRGFPFTADTLFSNAFGSDSTRNPIVILILIRIIIVIQTTALGAH